MLHKQIKFVDKMPEDTYHQFKTFFTAYDHSFEYFYEGSRVIEFMIASHEFTMPKRCDCKCCCNCKTVWETIYDIQCFCALEDGRVLRAYIRTDRRLHAHDLTYEMGINVKWENTRYLDYYHIDTVIPRIGGDIIPGGWLARFFSRR